MELIKLLVGECNDKVMYSLGLYLVGKYDNN